MVTSESIWVDILVERTLDVGFSRRAAKEFIRSNLQDALMCDRLCFDRDLIVLMTFGHPGQRIDAGAAITIFEGRD
jgi:hypothetical protein